MLELEYVYIINIQKDVCINKHIEVSSNIFYLYVDL